MENNGESCFGFFCGLRESNHAKKKTEGEKTKQVIIPYQAPPFISF